MIKKSFERSWVGLGPNVNEFEQQWQEFSGAKMAIGVNSATASFSYVGPKPKGLTPLT